MMLNQLFSIIGGVKLRAYKRGSADLPIKPAKIPKTLILPLQQHIGNPAKPIVEVGERVFKGQIIAQFADQVSVPIHASSSGTVTAIEERPVPHPSGLADLCIVIETDGLDQSRRKTPRHMRYNDVTPAQTREIIHNAGIVGLGGAGFPSFVKLNPREHQVETLILNGVECEPFITCDDLLMQERPADIINGLAIMQYALQAKRCVIAIENNKPIAYERMQQALVDSEKDNISVVQVPTVYPMGGEKQLIQVITGKEVPHQKIPLDINVVCLNVATAYATCRAVEHGEPLISRYITVAGSVSKARNFEVLIGTPISDLINQCGGNLQTLNRVIMGGPMMGFAIHNYDSPVVKTTNCILANSAVADVPMPSRLTQSLPCIRCGACIDVCPIQLLPHQLYWYAKAREFDRIQDFNLFDCIECGCCDYVCPSHIPLVQYYRFAKSTIWNQEREKIVSDESRERHEFRIFRLAREKQERADRHNIKRAVVSGDADTDKKNAAIQAAVARVKAKQEKTYSAPKNTKALSEEQQRLIDEVNQRRAQKKENNET